jgi:hypothetical protein
VTSAISARFLRLRTARFDTDAFEGMMRSAARRAARGYGDVSDSVSHPLR